MPVVVSEANLTFTAPFAKIGRPACEAMIALYQNERMMEVLSRIGGVGNSPDLSVKEGVCDIHFSIESSCLTLVVGIINHVARLPQWHILQRTARPDIRKSFDSDGTAGGIAQVFCRFFFSFGSEGGLPGRGRVQEAQGRVVVIGEWRCLQQDGGLKASNIQIAVLSAVIATLELPRVNPFGRKTARLILLLLAFYLAVCSDTIDPESCRS